MSTLGRHLCSPRQWGMVWTLYSISMRSVLHILYDAHSGNQALSEHYTPCQSRIYSIHCTLQLYSISLQCIWVSTWYILLPPKKWLSSYLLHRRYRLQASKCVPGHQMLNQQWMLQNNSPLAKSSEKWKAYVLGIGEAWRASVCNGSWCGVSALFFRLDAATFFWD